MKTFLTIVMLIFSVQGFTCESTGGQILLENGKKIELDVYGYSTIKFLARDVGPADYFHAEVTDNYVGFECEIKDVTKLSEGCWEVSVDWSPGADFSGCDIKISSNTKNYNAFLFMNYHAH